MFRRISTKLVLAVLAAVVLPFLGFAMFVNVQMSQQLSLEVVKQTLQGVAADLAGQVDRMVEERNADVLLWTKTDLIGWAIETETGDWGPAWVAALARGNIDHFSNPHSFLKLLTEQFDDYVQVEEVYDLVLLVSEEGDLETCNSTGSDGLPVDEGMLEFLFAYDYAQEEWFQTAIGGVTARVDWHQSPFLPAPADPVSPAPEEFHFAIARPVYGTPSVHDDETEPNGVLFALVNWRHLQDLVSTPVIKDYFRGLVRPGEEPSPYAWIWSSDCDTILAHQDHTLYGKRVSGPQIGLPRMVEDAQSKDAGMYRPYTFGGVDKNAAFKHCKGPAEDGFGWLVGVGINDRDIFAKKQALEDILVRATVLVLLVVLLWTMIIARTTTSPILTLQRHTRRVAEGDLDAEVSIDSRDELGELADAFNQMTRDLRDQRAKLVKAEKDAAWREMARQIAHDIKNPLTPIKLSLDLLDRARREGSGDVEAILDRTSELMHRQVDNLREIATDFYEFTGGRKPTPERFDLGSLVDEALQLHTAWADELGVEVRRSGEPGPVHVDPSKLRRVVVNLVSNALQAMPDGGQLEVDVRPDGRAVRLELRDSGRGLDPEVRAHLFEPYFTTRSEGTGLGLAIAKRVIEEMGGTIELEPREGERGTVARVRLPLGGA